MIVGLLITVLAGIVAIPVSVLALEILLSLVARRRGFPKREFCSSRPRIVVLVPAHNEETVLSRTLSLICDQVGESDMLLVVADNCNDRTAEIARESGATVLERFDTVNRGKGFALDYGIEFLTPDPPDVLVIVDADCLVGPDLIEYISTVSFSENRPVQALYLMKHANQATALSKRLVEFAWRVKNYARPLGLKLLGMPCQLMGSGMAIPFKQLDHVKLGSSNIVEDVQLGIDLAVAGCAPVFCPEVEVTSCFPQSERAEKSQRRRWEHGHIGMIISRAPGLLMKSLVKRDMNLFMLVLDLMVPPLTLLAILVLLMFGVSALAMLVGDEKFAFVIGGLNLFLFIFSVFLAWIGYGREIISITELMLLPILVLKKVPLYVQFAINRQKKWIRTERD